MPGLFCKLADQPYFLRIKYIKGRLNFEISGSNDENWRSVEMPSNARWESSLSNYIFILLDGIIYQKVKEDRYLRWEAETGNWVVANHDEEQKIIKLCLTKNTLLSSLPAKMLVPQEEIKLEPVVPVNEVKNNNIIEIFESSESSESSDVESSSQEKPDFLIDNDIITSESKEGNNSLAPVPNKASTLDERMLLGARLGFKVGTVLTILWIVVAIVASILLEVPLLTFILPALIFGVVTIGSTVLGGALGSLFNECTNPPKGIAELNGGNQQQIMLHKELKVAIKSSIPENKNASQPEKSQSIAIKNKKTGKNINNGPVISQFNYI